MDRRPPPDMVLVQDRSRASTPRTLSRTRCASSELARTNPEMERTWPDPRSAAGATPCDGSALLVKGHQCPDIRRPVHAAPS
eukprot:4343-Pyramimonas_sp.AAC.1